MPYWSSSRVGAMPTSSSSNPDPTSNYTAHHHHHHHHANHQNNSATMTTETGNKPSSQKPAKRSERYAGRNQPKGITMEDLKKQTALRLAQEQNRSPQIPGHGDFGVPAAALPTGVPVPSLSLQPRPQVAMNQYHPDTAVPHQQVQQQQQLQMQQQQPPHYQHRDARMDRSAAPYFDRNSNANNSRRTPPPTTQLQPSASYRNHPNHQQHQHQPYQHHYNMGGYAMALQHQQPETTPNVNTSKLPHGLTVQELKEMTRARLQAEAQNQHSTTTTTSNGSPSGAEAESSRPSSRASMQPSPQPPQPVLSPSQQQQQPVPMLQHQGSSFASSTTSSQRAPPQQQSSFLSTGTNASGGVWEQHPSSSNTTIHSSLNTMGPISNSNSSSTNSHPFVVVEGTSLLQQSHNHPSVASPPSVHSEQQPFARTSSFPNNSNNSNSSSLVANRRRAATLSPRLSSYVVHEDAASLSAEQLSLPSFSNGGFFPSNRARVNSAEDSLLFNRQRTSSAASMPALSHTADEFGMDDGRMVANATSSLKGDVIREVQHDADDDVAGLTQVFGLFATTSTSDKDLPDNPRTRASTWSDPSSWADSCGATASADFGDLRSILRLSGAEEQQHKQPPDNSGNNNSL
mmetsp:Transcript_13344/g.29375  ORF Transcript_13344/g.29375 Transcript_13344/m.29375 type:complete len:629 (+) Transcript_13344:126-2012(+)